MYGYYVEKIVNAYFDALSEAFQKIHKKQMEECSKGMKELKKLLEESAEEDNKNQQHERNNRNCSRNGSDKPCCIVADFILTKRKNASVEDLASNLRILHIVVCTILSMVVMILIKLTNSHL